jgi:hypothetical protein
MKVLFMSLTAMLLLAASPLRAQQLGTLPGTQSTVPGQPTEGSSLAPSIPGTLGYSNGQYPAGTFGEQAPNQPLLPGEPGYLPGQSLAPGPGEANTLPDLSAGS